ncbi:putative NADH:ubiquinone reductase (non-electrogenic) [Rosa chinensis]|uniref:Putative NADH:ubiquinone reductase (Non-electrogenic) n=1 Tax=Rosa chinensis TaxID=74649 RepID=A0A2P6QEH7_ROSCH|nr:apoptosis-inducing factor homolog B [Rosa chinensis]PRQ32593.1 putative NADH:ubiquinone reductase (non-electrogenic) [Rosa chinensis]
MELGGGERKRVVVIGGGVAGSLLAKNLQFSADFTLIDQKEYFEIPWASLRTMVEPSFGERSVINHRDYLTNGQIITSGAINITDTEVLTGEGRLIPYDYLVIATGHADSVPKNKTGRLKEYQEDYQKIRSANSILIVGGGPTGVELAGEIATDFPDKKITLVHTGSRLLEFIGPKAANKTLNWLQSRNVEVILEQSVSLNTISESPGSKTYQTSEGQTFHADCHFLCTGKRVGSAWLKETVLKSSLDEFGRLIVDENLRVKGRKNIFAVGDITNIKEIKQGYLAQKQALVAAKNIKLLLAGGRESKMATYEAHSVLALVSLGRKHGLAQFPYTTCIGRLPGLIKSKDLFVGKTRKQLGLLPQD